MIVKNNKILNKLSKVIILLISISSIGGIQSSPKNKKMDELKWDHYYPQRENKDLEWHPLKEKNNNADLIWDNINLEENIINIPKKYSENEILEKIENNELDNKLTQLGVLIPTASTFNSDYLNIYFDQVFPISEGEAGGSGNQNYSIFLNYGLSDDLLGSVYFSINDDPLHRKINGYEIQPANLWLNLGSSLKWRFYNSPKLSIAINSSLENWRVKSGGCNTGTGIFGSDCSANSPNIFNNKNEAVKNDNLVGSVSIPFTFNTSKKWEHTLVPKLSFLPDSQGNEHGKAEFYGTNYGIGYGLVFKPYKKLDLFSSLYIPLFGSKNTFDENLNFDKTIIGTFGFNYSLDTKTAFEGYITNSFGSTPSTGMLTVPSSNEILFGSRFIYTPLGFEGNFKNNSPKYRNLYSGILSVNNTFTIGNGKIFSESNISKGNYWTRLIFGISPSFDLDMSWEGRGTNDYSNSFEEEFLNSNSNSARIGGKALLYGKNEKNSFNSALRLSLGRKVFSDNWKGYFYSEITNSYHFSDKLTFNLNPKLASSDTNIYGLGIGFDYQLLKNLLLKIEYNLPLQNAEHNSTFAIRKKVNENNFVEIYTSNSYSFIDAGQLLKASDQYFGFKLGKVF